MNRNELARHIEERHGHALGDTADGVRNPRPAALSFLEALHFQLHRRGKGDGHHHRGELTVVRPKEMKLDPPWRP